MRVGRSSLVDGGATVSGWTWKPTVSTPIALTGVPPISAYGSLTFGITPRHGTLSFGQGIFTYAPQASDGGLSVPVSMGMPPAGGLIDNVIFLASADYPVDGNHTACNAEIIDVQSVGDPLAVDYANLPPRIHDTALTYDETANTMHVAWQEDGSESGLTGSLVAMGWEQFDDANLDEYTWVIYAPIGNAVTAPALTADLVAGFPTQDALTKTGQPATAEIGGDLFSTYAAFRQNAHPYTVQSAYPTTKGRFVMTTNGQ